MNHSVDNIYLNLSIENNTANTTSPAVFAATYDQPILDRPSDYYAAVVKFEIPLQTLPLLVAPIVQSDTKQQLITSAVGTAGSVITASGADIIGVGTAFTRDMVGGTIVFASGAQLPITEYISPTLLRTNVIAANPNQAYTIYNGEVLNTSLLATQAVNTVTLNRGALYTTMVGGVIIYSTGDVRTITAIQNPNTMTVGGAPLAVGPTSFKIYYSYNPNLTNYVIGICPNNQPGSKNGVLPYTAVPAFTENAIFSPNNQFISTNDIRYPYIYSYEVYTQLLNVALYTSWVKAGSPGGASAFPYLSYDPETEFLTFIMPAAFVNENVISANKGWTICFNNEFQTVAPSYPIYLSNDPAFVDGRYEINTNQFQGVELGPPTPGVSVGYDRYFLGPATTFAVTTYIVTQDFQTVDYINSARKIVIVTNSMPVRKEYFPPPNTINSGASNTIPIMSDFQLNLDNVAGAQRSVAIYESDIYRLIDLISDTPMKRIDIQLFWADQNNNLYPIYLTANDTATLKLGFFSKALYKGDANKL